MSEKFERHQTSLTHTSRIEASGQIIDNIQHSVRRISSLSQNRSGKKNIDQNNFSGQENIKIDKKSENHPQLLQKASNQSESIKNGIYDISKNLKNIGHNTDQSIERKFSTNKYIV